MVEQQRVSLPSVMDITTIQLLYDNFTSHAKNQRDICVDASASQKLTSPAMQLIVSLEKSCLQNNAHLLVEQHSEAFEEAFRDFGLLELLQKWSKEA